MRKNATKLPYMLIGSAVGSAVAYLFMTDSCRSLRRSVRNFDLSQLPQRIDEARDYVQRRGSSVIGRARDIFDRTNESIEVGKRAYHDAGAIAKNVDRSVRNLFGRRPPHAAVQE